MTEMIAFPIVVVFIVGTAFLTALVSTTLPSWPKYWHTFKTRIKRKKTKQPKMDMVDVFIISQLQDRIDEMEKIVNEVAGNNYRREQNRKSNVRREVRDYLQELAETKKEIK